MFAQKLGEALNVPVTVENIPVGAAGSRRRRCIGTR